MNRETLGVAMIAQNEAPHIPASLAQFFIVADDIVVVDGGSVDQTVEWAERLGARIFHRKFEHDFSAQKNFAIEQLNTDWVYVHDPDERLEPTLIEILPLLIGEQFSLMEVGILPSNAETFDCYGIPRKNFIDGKWVKPYPDYQYRLFRNYCRYEKPVHEEIVNFKNRTEIDFQKKTFEDSPRFNILHYKSSARQEEQNKHYENITKGAI